MADEDSIARFKDYLPQQILEMPKEERSRSVPMMFVGAANLAASEAGDIILQANLNVLMYEGLADYEGAKRIFQADLGEEPTGELTVWQILAVAQGVRRGRESSDWRAAPGSDCLKRPLK